MSTDGSSNLHEHPVATVREEGDAVVVALTGELDLYNAHAVRDTLVQACMAAQRVVVDLSSVSFIDSTAMGVLIEGRSHLRDRSGFILAGAGTETRRALEVSGLDRHFEIAESVESALAAPS